MSGKFDNKVVVVTGGTSGIGLATAKQFAAQGATVFVTGRRQAELDAAVKAIGGKAVGVQADMSKLADIDRLYDAVSRHRHDISRRLGLAACGLESSSPSGRGERASNAGSGDRGSAAEPHGRYWSRR